MAFSKLCATRTAIRSEYGTREEKKPTFNERRFSEGRCEPQWLDHSIRIKPPASMAIRQRM
jgi:hypothetical protein